MEFEKCLFDCLWLFVSGLCSLVGGLCSFGGGLWLFSAGLWSVVVVCWWFVVIAGSLWSSDGSLWLFAGGLWLFAGSLWSSADGLWSFVLVCGGLSWFVVVACFSNYALIATLKKKYYSKAANKLLDPSTSPKTYWFLLKIFLNNKKISAKFFMKINL